MATKRATSTAEFKPQAVQMVAEQKLSVAEAARRPGAHESRPHEWTKAHPKGGAAAFPGPGHQTPAGAELRQPRAEVKRPEVERDVLEKATAFFVALTK